MAAQVKVYAGIHVRLPDGRTVGVRCMRHAQARRIKLSVDDRGARVSFPPSASEQQVRSFVQQQAAWLAQTLDAHAPKPSAGLHPAHSQQFLLRGQQQPLHWHSGRSRKVWLDEAGVHVQLLPGDTDDPQLASLLHRPLMEFLFAQARADITRWLPRYADSLPRPPSRITYKRMRTRWGSQSTSGAMSLELSLILAPSTAFEYVLVHELCHILHHNHSPAFWAEVAKRMPDWKAQHQWLRQHGDEIKAQLDCWISS